MSYGRVFEPLACRAGRRKVTAKWLTLLTAVVATWTMYPVAGSAAPDLPPPPPGYTLDTPSPAPSFDPRTARPTHTLPPGLTPIHRPSPAPLHTVEPFVNPYTACPRVRPFEHAWIAAWKILVATKASDEDWAQTGGPSMIQNMTNAASAYELCSVGKDPNTAAFLLTLAATRNLQAAEFGHPLGMSVEDMLVSAHEQALQAIEDYRDPSIDKSWSNMEIKSLKKLLANIENAEQAFR